MHAVSEIEVRLSRAIADYESGDYAAAIEGLSALLRIDPDNVLAQQHRMQAAQAEAVAQFFTGCEGPSN